MENDIAIEKSPIPKKAWVILGVTYLASVTAPLAQFKVVPLAGNIIQAYGLDGVTFGYLMSALTIIGVLLAFPATFVINKIGLKNSMLLSVACCAIGTAISALTSSLGILYFSRLLEGVGIGLVGVAGPTCVSIWFPPYKRGTAMGLWATWVPLSIVFSYIVWPFVANAIGFRPIFWILFAVDVIAFVLFAIVFKMPENTHQEKQVESIKQAVSYLKNGKLWILGIVFLCFNAMQLGILNSFYNTFLESVGYANTTASSLTSVQTAIALVTMPFLGMLVDKVGNKRWILLVATFILYLISAFTGFKTGNAQVAMMWTFIIVAGVGGALAGAVVRPMAPNMVPNTALGSAMAMAVLQFMQNLANCVGSPVYGALYESIGWEPAALTMMIPLSIIGILLSLVFIPRKKNEDVK